jgi:hypothetical protein
MTNIPFHRIFRSSLAFKSSSWSVIIYLFIYCCLYNKFVCLFLISSKLFVLKKLTFLSTFFLSLYSSVYSSLFVALKSYSLSPPVPPKLRPFLAALIFVFLIPELPCCFYCSNSPASILLYIFLDTSPGFLISTYEFRDGGGGGGIESSIGIWV